MKSAYKFTTYLFYISIFIFCFIFFAHFHAPIIYSYKDWRYISYGMDLLTNFKHWEIYQINLDFLTSFLLKTARHLVYPLTGNFLQALSLTYATMLSLCIVFICIEISEFCKKVILLQGITAKIVVIFSLLIGCLIFLNHPQSNTLQFFKINTLSSILYWFPNLFSVAITLSWAKKRSISENEPYVFQEFWEEGWKIKHLKNHKLMLQIISHLFVDLFILTGLYSGIIFVSYVIFDLYLQYRPMRIDERVQRPNLWKRNTDAILFILFWMIWGIINPALTIIQGFNFYLWLKKIEESFMILSYTLVGLPVFAIYLSFSVIALAVLLSTSEHLTYKPKKIDRAFFDTFIKLNLSLFLLTLHLLGASALLEEDMESKSHVLGGVLVCLIVMTDISFGYLAEKARSWRWCVPIMLGITCLQIIRFPVNNEDWGLYKENTAIARAFSQHVYDTILTADRKNAELVQIEIPEDGIYDFPDAYGELVVQVLYHEGIIQTKPKVEVSRSNRWNLQ